MKAVFQPSNLHIMRMLINVLMLVMGIVSVQAQTKVEKTVQLSSNTKVHMAFKWPELIQIETWDGSEIKITASVDINRGANDDAFMLDIDEEEGELFISSEIKDYEDLPRKIVIKYAGEEYFFNTDDRNAPEVVRFMADKGDAGVDYTMHGVIMDIEIKVLVPKNVSLDVTSKFGLIEVTGLTNEMEISSKHGSVDVSVPDNSNVELVVKTKFGEAYSNLDTKFEGDYSKHVGRWETIKSSLNGGNKTQVISSEFGNVYLRKM